MTRNKTPLWRSQWRSYLSTTREGGRETFSMFALQVSNVKWPWVQLQDSGKVLSQWLQFVMLLTGQPSTNPKNPILGFSTVKHRAVVWYPQPRLRYPPTALRQDWHLGRLYAPSDSPYPKTERHRCGYSLLLYITWVNTIYISKYYIQVSKSHT